LVAHRKRIVEIQKLRGNGFKIINFQGTCTRRVLSMVGSVHSGIEKGSQFEVII